MSTGPRSQITGLVTALGQQATSDRAIQASAEELMLLVYPDLRRLARKYLNAERASHTLQPTAVVHEAYCRLVDDSEVSWQGRTHFYAVGARAMRRILVDHARARGRAKRGGDWYQIDFVDDLHSDALKRLGIEDLLSVNTALERLAELDPRQARILELRFFGGLTVAEVAAVLEVSKRTVEGDWTHARVWLERELESMREPQ